MALWDDIKSKNINLKTGELKYIDDAAGEGFETIYEMGDKSKGSSNINIADGWLNFDGYNVRSPRQNNIGPAGFHKGVPNHDPVRTAAIRQADQELMERELLGFNNDSDTFDGFSPVEPTNYEQIGSTMAGLDDFDSGVAANERARKDAFLLDGAARKAERLSDYENAGTLGKANRIIGDQAGSIFDSVTGFFNGLNTDPTQEKVVPNYAEGLFSKPSGKPQGRRGNK
jgi:hypothetical protein